MMSTLRESASEQRATRQKPARDVSQELNMPKVCTAAVTEVIPPISAVSCTLKTNMNTIPTRHMCFLSWRLAALDRCKHGVEHIPDPLDENARKFQSPTLSADTTHNRQRSTYKAIRRYYRGTGRAAMDRRTCCRLGCFVRRWYAEPTVPSREARRQGGEMETNGRAPEIPHCFVCPLMELRRLLEIAERPPDAWAA